MTDMTASLVVNLTGNLQARARQYGNSLDQFSKRGQRDLSRLSRTANALGKSLDNMTGRYTAAIGGIASGYAATRAVMQSADLDQRLIRVQQTAGATAKQAAALRVSLFAMSRETGQSVDVLLEGFNDLVQSGQSWDQALATIRAVNPAMAVTGAAANTLAGGLTVAAQAFNFDLSKPKLATVLLDKMTKAGRLGNAELEDLSGVFARIGVNAKSAGMDFETTLGFVERLSLIEKNPERLSTLADSTLRLFTNGRYMKTAAKATGVNFFDAKGNRRAAVDVLADISTQYKKLTTDAQRSTFIQNAFGKADLDTIKGLRTLLSGNAVGDIKTMTAEINKAGGTIAKDLPGAIDNAQAQTERLKSTLRDAADAFAQPINDTISHAIKYLLDDKKLTGGELMAGGALAAVAGFGLIKGGGKLLQRVGGLGAGIAAGKAVEQLGVQPVYVVNMPGGGFGGGVGLGDLPGLAKKGGWLSKMKVGGSLLAGMPLRALPSLGVSGLAGAGGLLAGAGAVGYGVGSLINSTLLEKDGLLGTDTGAAIGDAIGASVAHALAFFGNDAAQRAVAANAKAAEVNLKVEVEAKNGAKAKVSNKQDQHTTVNTSTSTTQTGGGNW